MSEQKDLIRSATFWGAIILIASMVANQLWGVSIDAEALTEQVLAVVNGLSALVGSVLTIWGRIRAKEEIGTVAGVPVKKESGDA